MARVHFTSVRFRNFKAFQNFSLRLDRVNVLVGPNNCGKSTLLGAFRVLEVGLRRAKMSDFNKTKGVDTATSNAAVTRDIEGKWSLLETRLPLVPGKKVLKRLRDRVQDEWKINLTDARIIDAFKPDEIPNDLKEFLIGLEKVASEE